VCQEAFLKAYKNIRGLREGSKFKSWVHHITLNLCRDRFRSPRERIETSPFEELGPEESRFVVERSGGARSHAERTGLVRAVEEVLSALPAEQRDAILLREYHGFNSEEIGEITGVPAATVRSRIFYGLRAARRMLEERGIAQA